MTIRKLLLFVTGLLVACQLGLAQSATMTGPNVQALGGGAVRFAKPAPVVSQSATPAGSFRPHIWLTGVAVPIKPHVPSPSPNNPVGLPCNTSWSGYFPLCPNGLQGAYSTAKIAGGGGGAGMVIAIVDAYDDPLAESDLNLYSSLFGLPPCTSASGCFTKLNQDGLASPLPPPSGSSGWAVETMLDLESAHSMAPNAKLVLVEGNSNSFDDLGTAVTTAVGLADVVSNSYGALLEYYGYGWYELTQDYIYDVNKPVLFSSGDDSAVYGVQYPCASPYVTCVGGTSLTLNAALQRVSETGWAGSGGGCSDTEIVPGYQVANGITACGGNRATPDIAADADPNTGLWEIDSYDYPGYYILVGGTSLACPLTAGLVADIDAARVSFGKPKIGGPSYGPFLDMDLYDAFTSNHSYFYYDVTSGNNGYPAGPGYDLVTGMGVSNGPAMANRFFGIIP